MSDKLEPSRSVGVNKINRILLFVIIFIALGLRIWGLGFGLPHLYHADEPIVVNHALAFGSGDLNPHFFKIPPLGSYLLFVCYIAYYLFLLFLGHVENTHDFLIIFLRDPSTFYLIARSVLGVSAGVLSVYLLYYLGRRSFSLLTGLTAAFFLATAFIHVRDSHYAYVDMLLQIWLLMSMIFTLEILSSAKRQSYLWFAMTYGAAVATKYNGFFLIAPFLIAHGYSKNKMSGVVWWTRLLEVLAISVAIFLLLNPFAVLDAPFFIQELKTQEGAEAFTGWFHHGVYSLSGGIGPFLSLSGLLAMFYGAVRRERPYVLIGCFIAIYYLVLVFKSQSYDRYILPVIPFVILLASDALQRFKRWWKISWRTYVLIVCFFALPSVLKIGFSNGLFIKEDVRTVAQKWIEAHISPECKIALDMPFYLPRLRASTVQLRTKLQAIDRNELFSGLQEARLKTMIELHENKRSYELYFLAEDPGQNGFLMAAPQIAYDFQKLKDLGIDYVLICPDQTSQQTFLKTLRDHAQLVHRFTPYRDVKIARAFDRLALTGGPFLWAELLNRDRNGQIIELYRLP